MKNPDQSIFIKLFNLKVLFGLLALITLAISLQQYFLPEREFWGALRPHYNNYLIFKYSFEHLIKGLNLYELYPQDHGDYFKYSPSFALFMGLFYYLPDWVGLILWNLLNTIILYLGVKNLPGIKEKNKVFILLLVLFELIGNLQNEQSNALMAGLLLLSFDSFENKNPLLASLFIVLGFYIKIFTIIGALLFLLYPKKIRFLAYFTIWMLIIAILPLIIISADQLMKQYFNWDQILRSDHETRYGFSILGILNKWFGLNPTKLLVMITGLFALCIPLIKRDLYSIYNFRLLFLASILIWVILFNHTAESSGYIIALTGCAIWYFSQPKTKLNTILIILTFVIVSLFSTDLMPANIRNNYIYPYYIRTLPIIIIWFYVLYDSFFRIKLTKK